MSMNWNMTNKNLLSKIVINRLRIVARICSKVFPNLFVSINRKTNVAINLWNSDLVPFATCFLCPLSLASFVESEKSFCRSAGFSSNQLRRCSVLAVAQEVQQTLAGCVEAFSSSEESTWADSKTFDEGFWVHFWGLAATPFFGLGPIIEPWPWPQCWCIDSACNGS